MEEIEVPTEHLHEHLEHEAEHGAAWISWVAVSTAVIAAIAAVASLLAGSHVNEAMIAQMKSSDQYAFYQAKSIKGHLVETEAELLTQLGKAEAGAEVKKKSEKYDKDKDSIKEQADKFAEESEHHLGIHERLAGSVTLCQIAIALAAISALTKRKPFWYISLGFGAGGAVLMALSLH
jgi:Domain of unknown function (DUF4337)